MTTRRRVALVIAAIWSIVPLLPYLVAGEHWGSIWYYLALPSSFIFKGTGEWWGPQAYVLLATAANFGLVAAICLKVPLHRDKPPSSPPQEGHMAPNETAAPQPGTPADSERKEKEAKAEQRKREKNMLSAFWATLGVGAATLLLFGSAASRSPTVFALSLLVGGAAALLGALLGFLFGLPRGGDGRSLSQAVGQPPQPPGGGNGTPAEAAADKNLISPNNNLLEISDWLTKIIVGAGLVGLKDLVKWLGTVGEAVGLGAELPSPAVARVYGCSLVVFFFAWGFLFVYIQTRTIISFIFATTTRSLQDLTRTISQNVSAEVSQKVSAEVSQKVSAEVSQRVTEVSQTASEGTILQLLYNSDTVSAAAELATQFLAKPGNEKNGRVWLYLAAAYGQQHARSTDADKKALSDKAYDALKNALELDGDGSLRRLASGLLYPWSPDRLPGDNDLESLNTDKRFQELVEPPPKP